MYGRRSVYLWMAIEYINEASITWNIYIYICKYIYIYIIYIDVCVYIYVWCVDILNNVWFKFTEISYSSIIVAAARYTCTIAEHFKMALLLENMSLYGWPCHITSPFWGKPKGLQEVKMCPFMFCFLLGWMNCWTRQLFSMKNWFIGVNEHVSNSFLSRLILIITHANNQTTCQAQ